MTRTLRMTIGLLLAMGGLHFSVALAEERAAQKPTSENPAAANETKPRVLVTISKETTFITEPLDKEGNVDYVAALNRHFSQGITAENNAAVLFWRAMGPNGIPADVRESLFRGLEMAPPAEAGDYFISLETYFNALDFNEQVKFKNDGYSVDDWWQKPLEVALKTPWSKEKSPLIARWLVANEKPLEVLVAASNRPRWYEPIFRDKEGLLIGNDLGISHFREVAKALVARALRKVALGRIDEAWQDLLAGHRLARLASQGPTIVDGIIAIVVEAITCQGDMTLLQHCPPITIHAARMLADLDRLPPIQRLSEKINWNDRYAYLDYVCKMARGDDEFYKRVDRKNRPYAMIAARFIDWDLVLREGNELYDQIVSAIQQPIPSERRKASDAITEQLQRMETERWRDHVSVFFAILDNPKHATSRFWSLVLMNLLTGPARFATDVELKDTMMFEITRTAFALAGYHADHGEYPARLVELAPKYMQTIPQDVFADATATDLRYKPEKHGYLLYSIGQNGEDDGGKSYEDREGNYNGIYQVGWDDLTIRVPAMKKPERRSGNSKD